MDIGTPNIAGYSLDGKVNGTVMIYRAACEFLGMKATWDPKPLMADPPCPRVDLDASGFDDEEALRRIVSRVYDIKADDAALRRIVALSETDRGPYFDRLRKTYPVRRDSFNTEVLLGNATDSLKRKVAGLGFKTLPAT